RPANATDPEVARDLDWVLRLPPRDLLRESEFGIAGADVGMAGDGAGEVASSERPVDRGGSKQVNSSAPDLDVPVAGEFQQWFSGGSPVDNGSRSDTNTSGSVTELRFAMQVGPRLDLSLDGVHGHEESRPANREEDSLLLAGRTTGEDRLGFALGYDFT